MSATALCAIFLRLRDCSILSKQTHKHRPFSIVGISLVLKNYNRITCTAKNTLMRLHLRFSAPAAVEYAPNKLFRWKPELNLFIFQCVECLDEIEFNCDAEHSKLIKIHCERGISKECDFRFAAISSQQFKNHFKCEKRPSASTQFRHLERWRWRRDESNDAHFVARVFPSVPFDEWKTKNASSHTQTKLSFVTRSFQRSSVCVRVKLTSTMIMGDASIFHAFETRRKKNIRTDDVDVLHRLPNLFDTTINCVVTLAFTYKMLHRQSNRDDVNKDDDLMKKICLFLALHRSSMHLPSIRSCGSQHT